MTSAESNILHAVIEGDLATATKGLEDFSKGELREFLGSIEAIEDLIEERLGYLREMNDGQGTADNSNLC